MLADYEAALAAAPLAPDSRRAYVSKVRQYLAWLAATDVDGDPLTDRAARDWAMRDYRSHLAAVAKRRPALFLNLRSGRLSTRGARDVLARLGAVAGLDDAGQAHVLRHTFATTLVRGGTDLVVVAELLGHARLETSRGYTRPTVSYARSWRSRSTVTRSNSSSSSSGPPRGTGRPAARRSGRRLRESPV